MSGDEGVRTNLHSRLDRLPWSGFHTNIIFALGMTWILDGLEVSWTSVAATRLTQDGALGEYQPLDAIQIGILGTVYIAGACSGSLFFGYLCDAFGRKKLFMLTPLVYSIATLCTANSNTFKWFLIFRFFTGFGIGGEYSAMNSCIDELIPARWRGTIDLAVNGSFWIGSAISSIASIYMLNTDYMSIDIGWRVGFIIGGILGFVIIFLRRNLPESPRWLMTHGKLPKAEKLVDSIEESIIQESFGLLALPQVEGHSIVIKDKNDIPLRKVLETIFCSMRRRAVLAFTLMMAQAFFYNAIFFTFATSLDKFYDVPSDEVGLYELPWAVTNFLGPITIGRLFDTWGRRNMISGTYMYVTIDTMLTRSTNVSNIIL
jgi:MFS family permease